MESQFTKLRTRDGKEVLCAFIINTHGFGMPRYREVEVERETATLVITKSERRYRKKDGQEQGGYKYSSERMITWERYCEGMASNAARKAEAADKEAAELEAKAAELRKQAVELRLQETDWRS